MSYQNNHSQKERRAQLAHDSFASRAANDIELESKERFGANKPQIIGEGAPNYPKGSAWTRDRLPDEPPLGYSVNDVPIVGERHEVQASLKRVDCASMATPRTEERAGVDGTGDEAPSDDTISDVRDASPVSPIPLDLPVYIPED